MEIKVLGPGCAKCQKTEELVKEAVAESGIYCKASECGARNRSYFL